METLKTNLSPFRLFCKPWMISKIDSIFSWAIFSVIPFLQCIVEWASTNITFNNYGHIMSCCWGNTIPRKPFSYEVVLQMINSTARKGETPSTSACGACKINRKKCSEKCVLAPYFLLDDPQKFMLVHTVFGNGHVIKLLRVSSFPCSIALAELGIVEMQTSVVMRWI